MNEVLRQSLLFDFYGDLLTEHQRQVYEDVVQNDLSYSEAAERFGVSRQSVHELVKRCGTILEQYETKLELVDRFLKIRSNVQKLCDLSSHCDAMEKDELAGQVRELSEKILEEL